MNDDLRTDERPRAPVHFEHYCGEPSCNKWGGHGYEIGRGETRWFCWEHRWDEYPSPKGGGSTSAGRTR